MGRTGLQAIIARGKAADDECAVDTRLSPAPASGAVVAARIDLGVGHRDTVAVPDGPGHRAAVAESEVDIQGRLVGQYRYGRRILPAGGAVVQGVYLTLGRDLHAVLSGQQATDGVGAVRERAPPTKSTRAVVRAGPDVGVGYRARVGVQDSTRNGTTGSQHEVHADRRLTRTNHYGVRGVPVRLVVVELTREVLVSYVDLYAVATGRKAVYRVGAVRLRAGAVAAAAVKAVRPDIRTDNWRAVAPGDFTGYRTTGGELEIDQSRGLTRRYGHWISKRPIRRIVVEFTGVVCVEYVYLHTVVTRGEAAYGVISAGIRTRAIAAAAVVGLRPDVRVGNRIAYGVRHRT